ncbi:MAG TPA: TonB-dependent receptor, partial [Stellaceae bacterium]|nr:TonB-dependent receptor [Stellaceae bacterium]
RRRISTRAALSGGISLLALATSQAWADDSSTLNIGTVQTTVTSPDYGAGTTPDSAPYNAPTKAPLTAVQPTSVISHQYIQTTQPLSANYDDVVKIAPSVYAVSPNGPGLMENQGLSIRGFADGQYNVTFDGIPWGDSNDFTHHSTSYFMAHDLGDISVDRGPGTASTIGDATFGGTIAITSKDPLSKLQVDPYFGGGSFGTYSYGGEFDTGTVAQYGGTTMFLDAQGMRSDGYLTHSGQQRQNGFVKILQPIGENTVVTVVGMVNQIQQNVSLGATKAQIAQFGPNFALSANPNSQNFYGYNQDHIHTDFEYIGVKSKFGDGWHLDDKAYTYAYYHQGWNGLDPNGETPNGTQLINGTVMPNDVPGQLLENDYRSFGNILKMQKDFSFGDIQSGIWVDGQSSSRGLTEVDFTQGSTVINLGTGVPNGIDRELEQHLTTLQPYLQVDWKPIPGLTISPGLKWDYFDRSVAAAVNVKTGTAQNYDNTFDAVLPSLLVHYKITPDWAVYAQAAEGFLAPNENFFNQTDPNGTTLKPQQSWNYQIGTSYQTKRLSLSGDIYFIDFSNLLGEETVGGITTAFNQGGVRYSGIEAEGTYYVGDGFSVYGNGSLNDARDKATNLYIANAPTATAAAGVIYNKNSWTGSLIEKWVGSRYGDVNKNQGLDPYGTLDLSVGYTLTDGPKWAPPATIKVDVSNLYDSTKIYGFAGTTVANGTPLYWTIPGRSVFTTVSIPFF